MTQEETKARVDALIANAKEYIQKMYYAAIEEEELEIEHQDFVHICILSTQNTIESLKRVIEHDKKRYGITCRGATIELDNELEILKELESRL